MFTIITTAALTASLLGGGALPIAVADDTPPTVTCTLGTVWSRLPEDLRNDLKALRDLEPGQERIDAAKEIRDGALAGDYGAGVQKRAEAVKEHGVGTTMRLWLLNNCS